VHGRDFPGIPHLWWCSAYPEYSSGKVLRGGDPSQMTDRGIFSSALMHHDANAHGDVLRHGWSGWHSPGSRAGIPGAAANPAHQEGRSRGLAKPQCFLLVRLRVRAFCFLVPEKPTIFEQGTWSSLFIFESVLTVWLTKGRMLQSLCWKSKLLLAVLCRKGMGRGKDAKPWAESGFRALTLNFLALVGLSWS